MRPLRYIPRYTVDDYRLWEGDWELIDGLAYAMSPPPVIRHQRLGTILLTQISSELERKKSSCGNCMALYEVDWIVDTNTIVRPDITIVCDNKGDYITKAPVLVIEILSPSTAFKDRQVKFDIYQENGVMYYLLVDPTTKIYTFYKLVSSKYIEQKNAQAFIIHDGCEIMLDIDKALAELE